ncbi:hypothetical protein ACFBZI_11780 [Moraxella sp. ZJ142]|uniref:hypothetical protein n=1 Tax=Moraxella marmotae TaxID=3344520 RepID=UPI0035D4B756
MPNIFELKSEFLGKIGTIETTNQTIFSEVSEIYSSWLKFEQLKNASEQQKIAFAEALYGVISHAYYSYEYEDMDIMGLLMTDIAFDNTIPADTPLYEIDWDVHCNFAHDQTNFQKQLRKIFA